LSSDPDRFWEITLDGAAFHTRFGAIDTPGETSVKTWPDAARARAEYDKAIAHKQARGFALEGTTPAAPATKRSKARRGPARNPALEAEIAKNLDDVDAYRVYGDWLTEQGDVRGELVALQTKPGHAAAATALVEEHREHFFGDLHHLSEEMLQVTWRYGFIDSIRIEKVSGGADDEDRSVGELLRCLLEHPSVVFVRKLAFGTVDGIDDGMIDYQSVLDTLDALTPPYVESIHLGDWAEWEVSWSAVGDATAFWKLPRLHALTIRAGSMALGEIISRSLHTLEIITGGLTRENIASLVTANLPALDTLRVYFGSSGYGATGGVDDLAPLLAGGKRFAKLRHLGLMNAEFTDELCAALGKAPLVRQLATLDLSKGTMSSAGVDALVANTPTFAHLDKLDVSENWLAPADVQRLAQLAKTIVSERQREGDDRYVVLGE
jgi:uncharacterized protein (TIGR02996 family)